MQAFGPTGYVKFVKTFEFTGALLVMIPRLRNLGLLLLGPVIVNILAFHLFEGCGRSRSYGSDRRAAGGMEIRSGRSCVRDLTAGVGVEPPLK